ncbi:hypothetical protein ACFQ3Z_43440 [Streptomyces nogalater]
MFGDPLVGAVQVDLLGSRRRPGEQPGGASPVTGASSPPAWAVQARRSCAADSGRE